MERMEEMQEPPHETWGPDLWSSVLPVHDGSFGMLCQRKVTAHGLESFVDRRVGFEPSYCSVQR